MSSSTSGSRRVRVRQDTDRSTYNAWGDFTVEPNIRRGTEVLVDDWYRWSTKLIRISANLEEALRGLGHTLRARADRARRVEIQWPYSIGMYVDIIRSVSPGSKVEFVSSISGSEGFGIRTERCDPGSSVGWTVEGLSS